MPLKIVMQIKNTVDCHATEKAFNFYTTQEPIFYLLLQGTGAVASMNNEERLTQINNLFRGLHFLIGLAIHTCWHTTGLCRY